MISKPLETIGTRAKQARRSLGLTQEHAAKKIDGYRRAIIEIEKGQYDGNMRLFERYMSLLGLELTVIESKRPEWDELDDLYRDDE